MKFISLMTSSAALAAISLFSSFVSADIVITAAETSNGISVQGGGTLDLAGLSIVFEGDQDVGINPALPVIVAGGAVVDNNVIDSYGLTNRTIPADVGTGINFVSPTSTSGDTFGFGSFFGNEELFVPDGYASGDPLAATSFYQGQTLASLGLTPGSYSFTIPSGNLVTLNINAIPEPTGVVMLGLASLIALSQRRRLR